MKSALLAPIGLLALLGLSLPTAGQNVVVPAPAVAPMRPTLTVTGEGEAATRPDRATVALGVTAQADQANVAQQQVNEQMTKVLEAIEQLGIPKANLSTSGLSLYPVYSEHGGNRPMGQPPHDNQPRVVGYRASNTIRVLTDDLDLVGRVIDAGIAAGSNQLEGVFFELKDDTAQRAEALKQAAAAAKLKATALAEAMGVKLETVEVITEGGVNVMPPQPHMARMSMAEMSSTPVEPGQMRVQASVTVTYRVSDAAGQ